MQSIGECHGCLTSEPSFLSASASNFHLASSSTAIDKGAVESAYAHFSLLYGINISKDRGSVARPQGIAWDIGAYEYPTNTALAPAAPLNLRVISH